ncbi:M20 family metallopeptidase [Halorutilales archaeon Cl-col2-1]
MDEVESLTRRLVTVGVGDDCGEEETGDLVESWLRRETDAEVERDAVGNVIARKGEGSPSLGLVGHHDVVPPDESQIEDGSFVVDKRDGRLYGRGTADMKGSLAAAMLGFGDADPSSEVLLCSFVGEEKGGIGARHAVENGVSPDRAVVVEGSTGYSSPRTVDVGVAHRGRREWELTARGESGHASQPDEAVNAVYEALAGVEEVRNYGFETVEVAGEEISGTAAVTRIESNVDGASNVIPETCRFTVDERTVPRTQGLEPVSGLESDVVSEVPAMECDDDDFVSSVLAASSDSDETDRDPDAVVKPHATDAGWLSRAGTDCVVCGAAERGEAHTADESVSLSVLRRCRRIYSRLIGT